MQSRAKTVGAIPDCWCKQPSTWLLFISAASINKPIKEVTMSADNINTTSKIKSFVKKHKKPLIIAGVVYLVLMIGVVSWAISAVFGDDNTDSSYTPPEDKYPRVDVNGLSVQEACTKLQEKGWKIESVYGNTEDYSDSQISDCDKANGKVSDVSYYGDSLSLYYVYEKDIASSTETKQEDAKTETLKARFTVSEDAAEHYCQDAGLLNNYIDSSKISTIYVTDYNKRYTDSYTYDNNGNPIWYFQWNGKNKSSGDAVSFSCWISGSSDKDITLHRLTISGNTVVGETFDSYREDGTKIE